MFHVKPSLHFLDDVLIDLRRMAEDCLTLGQEDPDFVRRQRERIEYEHMMLVLAYVVWMPDSQCGALGRCYMAAGHYPLSKHRDSLMAWTDSLPYNQRSYR